jgi:hypothetical protein
MNLFNSDIFCAMDQNPEHFPINCRVSFISIMHATRLANRLDSISRTQVSNFLQPPSFELVLRIIPLESPPDFVTSALNPVKSRPLRLSADVASAAGFTQAGLQLDEHGDVGVPAEGGGNQACAFWILGGKNQNSANINRSIKISRQHSYILNTSGLSVKIF